MILISIGFVVVVGGAAGMFYLRQTMNQATPTPVTPYGRAMPNQNLAWAWTSPDQDKINQYTAELEADPSSFSAFL